MTLWNGWIVTSNVWGWKGHGLNHLVSILFFLLEWVVFNFLLWGLCVGNDLSYTCRSRVKKGPTQPFSHRIWVGSPYNLRDLCAAKDKVQDVKILPDFKMHPPTHPSLSQLLGNIFGNHRPEHTLSQPASPLEIWCLFLFMWLTIHVTH